MHDLRWELVLSGSAGSRPGSKVLRCSVETRTSTKMAGGLSVVRTRMLITRLRNLRARVLRVLYERLRYMRRIVLTSRMGSIRTTKWLPGGRLIPRARSRQMKSSQINSIRHKKREKRETCLIHRLREFDQLT